MTELSTTSGVTCPQVRVWDEGVLFRVYWKLKGSLTALNPRSCSWAADPSCMAVKEAERRPDCSVTKQSQQGNGQWQREDYDRHRA